jgi:hypothetical protein
MWKGHLLPTIHLQRLVLTTLFWMKKAIIGCVSNNSN